MTGRKPILCLDFDGVIHEYSSGWKGADVIPDPPVDGAIHFILEALEHFDVQIFSSRSNQPGGREAMIDWLLEHGFPPGHLEALLPYYHGPLEPNRVKFPTEKPPAMVTIDDRAITFDGTWPAIEELKTFQSWNKR